MDWSRNPVFEKERGFLLQIDKNVDFLNCQILGVTRQSRYFT